MTSGKETLYLKIDKNIIVKNRNVTLQDIAKMECKNEAILRQLKQKKIYTFPDGQKKTILVVFSILKVIQFIHEEYPDLEISNQGEQDFIIEYENCLEKPKWQTTLLTVLLCIVIFFGAAFTIMSFNNDIGITDVFTKFYRQVMGSESDGRTELEFFYCIGLSLGIIIFFNHIGHKKITHDPTPIQVEMRKYENDIDTAFIDNAERKGHSIDVD